MTDITTRLRGSTVEQRFCEPPVAGSTPAAGFITDAEREAIEWASKTLCVGWHDLAAEDKQRTRDAAATLQSLLDRMA